MYWAAVLSCCWRLLPEGRVNISLCSGCSRGSPGRRQESLQVILWWESISYPSGWHRLKHWVMSSVKKGVKRYVSYLCCWECCLVYIVEEYFISLLKVEHVSNRVLSSNSCRSTQSWAPGECSKELCSCCWNADINRGVFVQWNTELRKQGMNCKMHTVCFYSKFQLVARRSFTKFRSLD